MSLGSGVGRFVKLEISEPDNVRVTPWVADTRSRDAGTTVVDVGVTVSDGFVLCTQHCE